MFGGNEGETVTQMGGGDSNMDILIFVFIKTGALN